MAKKYSVAYVAYLKDGTAVSFKHAIDHREGIKRGMLNRSPGVSEPVKKKKEADGEKISGIEPIIPASKLPEEVINVTELDHNKKMGGDKANKAKIPR